MASQHRVVVAVAKAQSGKEDELGHRIQHVAEQSWLEPGVISYAVHAVADEPGQFMMVEVYASDEAFQDHLDTEHVKSLIADLPGLVDGDLLVYQGHATKYSAAPKGLL
jgi:quinol monooxygenase YgiN